MRENVNTAHTQVIATKDVSTAVHVDFITRSKAKS